MNRQQRRQARHRNPALAARAKFEGALRTELARRDIRLISASTAEMGKVPCWVLVVKRGDVEMTLSAKPQGVIALAEAVKARFDDPDGKKAAAATAAITAVGPDAPRPADAQPSAPRTVTGDAPGNGLPLIELSDDPEAAAEQLFGLASSPVASPLLHGPDGQIPVPDTSYDDLLSSGNDLLPGAR